MSGRRLRAMTVPALVVLGAGLGSPQAAGQTYAHDAPVAVTAYAEARAMVRGSAVLASQPAAVRGNAKAYAFLDGSGGVPARWNPCAPITYRVNPRLAPKGYLADVKGALARIDAVAGLRHTYLGTTTAVPGTANATQQGTDLVIAWAKPGTSTSLPAGRSSLAGTGGGTWTTGYTADGAPANQIIDGYAILNATMRMAPGFAAGPATGMQGTTGQLLMHELGHATGLGHPAVADRTEIMFPMMTRKPAVFGVGDVAGLRKVGKAGGCLTLTNPKAPPAADDPGVPFPGLVVVDPNDLDADGIPDDVDPDVQDPGLK